MVQPDYPVPSVVDADLQAPGGDTASTESEPIPDVAEANPDTDLAQETLHVQAAYEFLDTKGVILWADFLISHHHGRLRAARWLAQEMAGVEKVLTSNWGPA